MPTVNIISPDSFGTETEKHPLGMFPIIENPLSEESDKDISRIIEGVRQEFLGIIENAFSKYFHHDSKTTGKKILETPENKIVYDFLNDVMLPSAQTEEQAKKLFDGLLVYLFKKNPDVLERLQKQKNYERDIDEDEALFIPEIVQLYNNLPNHCGKIEPEKSDDPFAEIFKMLTGAKYFIRKYLRWMGERWEAIKNGRNKIGEVLLETMNVVQITDYFYYNTTNDGPVIIMADPDSAATKSYHFSDVSNVKTERKIPENKRMTKAKLARLLQLKGLKGYIERDTISENKQRHETALGSNLAVIAEYFCENDDAEKLNEITPEHVDKWLRKKFETYKPPVKVALYQWARLLQTDFEQTCPFIEQYILDLHQEQDPWLFEFTEISRESCKKQWSLFRLYNNAFKRAKEQSKINPDIYKKVLAIMPSNKILTPAFKTFGTDSGARNIYIGSLMSCIHDNSGDFWPEFSKEKIREDVFGASRELFKEIFAHTTKWEGYEGFEILDPITIDNYSRTNKFYGMHDILKDLAEELEKLSAAQLFQYKTEIVNELPDYGRKEVMKIIERIADRYAIKFRFSAIPTKTLINIVEGRRAKSPEIMLGDGIKYSDIVDNPEPDIATHLADLALAERFFGNGKVIGGRQIIDFLMSHRNTLYISQLIRPYLDSPNPEIIKKFRDDPNLLAYLPLATMCMYKGYSPDSILREADLWSRISEQENRPEITSVGIEYEQAGSSNGGVIITDTYNALYNVYPKGNDPNELTTYPTTAGSLQALTLDLFTSPHFNILNRDKLFNYPQKAPLTSIHVNVAIPKEVPFDNDVVRQFFSPLQTAVWASHGGDPRNVHETRLVGGWHKIFSDCTSLLDILEDKHPRVKIELRNTIIMPDGSHNEEILDIQMLASACNQLMLEMAGRNLTPNGKIMVQIYKRFSQEANRLQFRDESMTARKLVKQYADEVRNELKLGKIIKPDNSIIAGVGQSL